MRRRGGGGPVSKLGGERRAWPGEAKVGRRRNGISLGMLGVGGEGAAGQGQVMAPAWSTAA